MKRIDIDRRCVLHGQYIVTKASTVRNCAKKFGVSKSTVHKDVTKRLQETHPQLYIQVCDVLKKNAQERHLRGGEATKRKYHPERTVAHI